MHKKRSNERCVWRRNRQAAFLRLSIRLPAAAAAGRPAARRLGPYGAHGAMKANSPLRNTACCFEPIKVGIGVGDRSGELRVLADLSFVDY